MTLGRIVATCCAVLCLTACGGLLAAPTDAPAESDAAPPPPKKPSRPPPDSEEPDAGVPPHTTRCTTPRPADPPPTFSTEPPAFFASHPMPQITNQGGAILASPRVVPIFFAGDELAERLDDFVGSFGCTTYWRSAVGEYGVGDALAAPAVHLAESAPTKISESAIEDWLAAKIASKALEPPAEGSVYTIFYPETTTVTLQGAASCESFGGYHTNIQLPDGTKVAYAVVPRCPGFLGLDTLDSVTGATSHEIIEAATDPYNKDAPAFQITDPDHLAFSYVIGGETADMCAQGEDAFFTPDGYPYTVQRSWSNRRAQEGLDPCAPAAAGAFFTAAPAVSDSVVLDGSPTLGVRVPAGTTKTIDVALYSEAAGDELVVDVVDVTYVMTGTKGTAKYALEEKVGRSGDTLKLTITAPTGPDTEIFAIYVTANGTARVAWAVAVSQ